jgi:hypothetical protein
MSERPPQNDAKKSPGGALKQWVKHRALRTLVRVGISKLRRAYRDVSTHDQKNDGSDTADKKILNQLDTTKPVRKSSGVLSSPGWDDSGYDWILANTFVMQMKDAGMPLTSETALLDI